MLRRNVKARMVKSIGWENEIMEVEYVSGLIHQYKDVFVKSGLIIEDYKNQSHEEDHNDGSDDEELKEYLINYNEKMKDVLSLSFFYLLTTFIP